MITRFLFCVMVCIGGVAVRAADAPAPIGHWKLDGNGSDSAAPAHDGKVLGRAEYQDSPIGRSGKSLWCDGVGTAVRIEGEPNMAAGDFAVSLWACPLELRPSWLIGQGSLPHGWSIELLNTHALRFRIGGRSIDTVPDRIGFGQWYHITAATHSGHATLYVNGEAAASGDLATDGGAEAQPLLLGMTAPKGPYFTGLIDEVRLYNNALDAGGVGRLTDAGLPGLRPKPRAKTPFAGHFSLEPDDVVVWVGGEDANTAHQFGYLETILTAGAAIKHPLFRNMAWEGDTVFEQWRILNFGPWSRQFERVGASVIIMQFGQMESMEGKAGLAEFTSAYEKLLDEFQQRTQRIVLVAPTPFQATAPPAPDLTRHNADLALYTEALRKLADRRGLLFVDLFTPLQSARSSRPLTRDGAHLTPYGQWIAAQETARQLGFNATDPVTQEEEPRFERKELEQIRTTVQAKNALWRRYWRPTNWAFFNGDRVSQPSSRDHLDSRVRWLPEEVQEYSAMIAKEEAKIAGQAKTLAQP